jgi:uncharacterized protein YndB with AHSA1/START domain
MGSLVCCTRIGADGAQGQCPFFFEAEFEPAPGARVTRHPHYGRFLRLEQDKLVELTWVTGDGGTEGTETLVTVELAPRDGGTRLKLSNAGFATAAARDRTEAAWPLVLAQLDQRVPS